MTKPIKTAENIAQLLAEPWVIDIEELWAQAAHNPDPDKHELMGEQYLNKKCGRGVRI